LSESQSIPKADRVPSLAAAILDVDGVLLASPHEQAWREALTGLADPERFTTTMYQAHVAGKPRGDGALAALEQLGVADARQKAAAYAERKQARLEALVRAGAVRAFADAMRFVAALEAMGMPMAVASASKNANDMLKSVPFAGRRSLFDVFAVNVCGRDLERGKPDPQIFLVAAAELAVTPMRCFVAEDAPAGIAAALAGRMAALGVARRDDDALLRKAAADLVVNNLDEVAIAELAAGRLSGREKSWKRL
jgi:HAD superfamily hydrolase (TIGR01509 family)